MKDGKVPNPNSIHPIAGYDEEIYVKPADFSQIEQSGQLKRGKGLFDFGDVKIHI